MSFRRSVFCAVFLLLIYHAQSDTYFPKSCSKQCGPKDYIKKLPVVDGPFDSKDNRAYAWAIIAMIQTKLHFKMIAPPVAGRICAILGTCLYEAIAMSKKGYRSDVGFKYKFSKLDDELIVAAALEGAGFWAVKSLFEDLAQYSVVFDHYKKLSLNELVDLDRHLTQAIKMPPAKFQKLVSAEFITGIAASQGGAAACQAVIDKYTSDGFTPRGELGEKTNPVKYEPKNRPQKLAGITDCDDEYLFEGKWQPLCVPRDTTGFGTTFCTRQEFLTPWASRYRTYALRGTNEKNAKALADPPPKVSSKQYEEDWKQVLKISSELDDVEKVIAEYWADGPDSTMPPGHFWKIAAEAARSENLSPAETARLLMMVGNAVYDAGIASWRTKVSYDFVRPLQMIQCGEYHGKMKEAWKGPYQGTGRVNISEWRPYQASNFVTPAFAGYTSGHSTFSAAASETLRLFFGNDRYRGPSCHLIPKGASLFEPKSNLLPGISDRPNKGPNTPGYVPREDVIICWDTFTAASDQSGISRLYGGIHVKADDTAGQKLGRQIGRDVFKKAKRLTSR